MHEDTQHFEVDKEQVNSDLLFYKVLIFQGPGRTVVIPSVAFPIEDFAHLAQNFSCTSTLPSKKGQAPTSSASPF